MIAPPESHRNRMQQGFTLLELLIVVAILATLVAIAVPGLAYYVDKTRYQVAISDLRSISLDILVYHQENNAYPDSLHEVGRGASRDPWGNPYQYLRIDGAGVNGRGQYRKDRNLVPVNTDYDLYSKGKDGKSASPFTSALSQDDIVRCNNGSYFGLVSDY